MNRRGFLKFGFWGSLSWGLLPCQSLFAAWPIDAFNAKSIAQALVALFESSDSVAHTGIFLQLPEIAENGAIVSVQVDASALPLVEKISLLAEKNRQPLVASFTFPKGTLPRIATRIRLAESMFVRAVVRQEGKLYHTQQYVTVVIGGCTG